MLKLELAGAIREAGWYAELEVPAEDGSWRADANRELTRALNQPR
ncbi:hypothetical protein [Streptomyces sp. NPDC003015]